MENCSHNPIYLFIFVAAYDRDKMCIFKNMELWTMQQLFSSFNNCIQEQATTHQNSNQNKTLTFYIKNVEKEIKILSSKHTLKLEEIIPLKSLFVLSRYLNRLPRYENYKFV